MKLSFISLLFLFYLQTSFASPLIVAHRAGTADFPENTRHAISKSLSNNVDMVWITVQLSKDGVPVLYRPKDLSELTDGDGPVSKYTFDELLLLDAAYHFKQGDPYIYRGWAGDTRFLHCTRYFYPTLR